MIKYLFKMGYQNMLLIANVTHFKFISGLYFNLPSRNWHVDEYFIINEIGTWFCNHHFFSKVFSYSLTIILVFNFLKLATFVTFLKTQFQK